MKPLYFFAIVISGVFLFSCMQPKIQLIVRADDMGFCHAANIACVDAYKDGIVSSVEVLVPGPEFYEAAQLLQENPGLDVGVHLCLTSEWDNYKWGPITQSPGLLTTDGYFPATNEELYSMNMSEDEIYNELKAQIDTAIKYIPQVTHVSTHMFSAKEDKRLRKAIDKLADEYKLPTHVYDSYYGNFWEVEPDKKEEYLAKYLNKLWPGLHIFVLHPVIDCEESRGIKGSEMDPNIRMAVHRQAVTNAVKSKRIREIITERNIELVSYGDIISR